MAEPSIDAPVISWHEWGDDAFELARREDRPVLLSIAASWCHWCHVMDRTTYADPRVVELLASRFVPVRVDADVRPDVDARYNAGGWPTTAFLTPDGDVITSATYLDPEAMLEALGRVHQGWLVDRDGIAREVEAARVERQAHAAARAAGGELTPAVLEMALEALEDRADLEHGGWFEAAQGDRAALKFPHPEAIRLLAYAARRREQPALLEAARDSLLRMLEAPVFDAYTGGIFRYATQPDWSQPHVEKLTGDQGALLRAIGAVALADEEARERLEPYAVATIEYLQRVLSDPAGGFRGSQDADEDYYALDPFSRTEAEPPAVDPRVFATSTALVAQGLIACGTAYERGDWTDRGLVAVDFLLSRMRAGEAGMYHVWEGQPTGLGLLADQAQTLLAVLEAYQVTGAPRYLDQAQALVRAMTIGWHEPGRGFWDVPFNHERTGLLTEPRKPLAENAAVAEGLLWLAHLTHDSRHIDVAHDTLVEFAGSFTEAPFAGSEFARVADRFLSAEPEIKVVAEYPVGEPDRFADEMVRAALRLPVASRTVQRLQRDTDEGLFEALGVPREPSRVAYVCIGMTCSSPLTEPDQLEPAIVEMQSAPAW